MRKSGIFCPFNLFSWITSTTRSAQYGCYAHDQEDSTRAHAHPLETDRCERRWVGCSQSPEFGWLCVLHPREHSCLLGSVVYDDREMPSGMVRRLQFEEYGPRPVLTYELVLTSGHVVPGNTVSMSYTSFSCDLDDLRPAELSFGARGGLWIFTTEDGQQRHSDERRGFRSVSHLASPDCADFVAGNFAALDPLGAGPCCSGTRVHQI